MRTEIVYEDREILVCYKPAGLASQTAKPGQPDMVSELKNYLAGKAEKKQSRYLGVIHRLDQPVEGLLVFARTSSAAAKLSAELSAGTLNKRYYAVVCGKPDKDHGCLTDYLIKDAKTGSARVVTEEAQGKKAVLTYCVKKTIPEPAPFSLLEIRIETGRFHQIRVQTAHAGFPILGDSRYGSEASLALGRELFVRNVALCACHISFRHPTTGKQMEFTENPRGPVFSRFL